MREIFVGKTGNALFQFIRYCFVGAIAAAADTGCLYVLNTRVGINHLLAAAMGFLVGLVTNYLISIAWVFESSGEMKRELVLFAIIGAGGLGWTELILWAAVNRGHAPVLGAKVVAIALVLVWNFGMRKKFVFAQA